jgi:hypothetical protein
MAWTLMVNFMTAMLYTDLYRIVFQTTLANAYALYNINNDKTFSYIFHYNQIEN